MVRSFYYLIRGIATKNLLVSYMRFDDSPRLGYNIEVINATHERRDGDVRDQS